jgi:hypothetical protein
MTAETSFSLLTGNSNETLRVRAGGVIFREGEQADEQSGRPPFQKLLVEEEARETSRTDSKEG